MDFMIKKLHMITVVAVVSSLLLAGCSGKNTEISSSQSESTASQTTTTTETKKTTIDFRKQEDPDTLGVWWWQISTIKNSDNLMTFLKENTVSEIYLCIDGMSEAQNGRATFEDVRAFVKKAGTMGIRVAALTGDYRWVNPDDTGFERYVKKFKEYQSEAADDEKFYSMHLDVEPHQHPEFKTGAEGRAKVMQLFADFVVNKAVPAAKEAGTLLEWDIPFWMTDIVKDSDGSEIVLAEMMAKYCDTIAIMSYRDTATKILDVSKEEIEYAKKYGCKIILGAETKSSEGDAVSFMEEGKAIMVAELEKVHKSLKESLTDISFGLAVHQASVWFSLKD
jgi:hypothetical protein